MNALSASSSRQAWVSAGAPIVVLVLIIIAMNFTVVAGFARQQDRDFEVQSRHLVESALQARVRALENMAVDYAAWDDAYRAISVHWSLDWLQNNYYSNVADAIIVTRAHGAARYVWMDDAFASIGPALEARATAGLRQEVNLADLMRIEDGRHRVAVTFVRLQGRPVIIAVAPVSPSQAMPAANRDVDYLIMVDVLSEAEVGAIGGDLHLQHLRFALASNEAEATSPSLPLQSARGATIGALSWVDEHPGSRAFFSNLWPILATLLLIGALTIVVARRLVGAQVRAMAETHGALEVSRLKSEFIATMSHELRTPLNAIIGYTELIQEEAAPLGKPGETISEDADRVLAAAKHLGRLVSDILDQSRIDAGRLKLTPELVHVDEALSDLQDLLEPAAHARGNRLEVSWENGAGIVTADPVRLMQCLINLTGNAIKFTQAGLVSVHARAIAGAGAPMIAFEITDTGIGIAKAELDQLFAPFHQANGGIEREYGGTGLGLAISRSLARAMGGDVRAASAPGAGSTFTLVLPAAVAALEAA